MNAQRNILSLLLGSLLASTGACAATSENPPPDPTPKDDAGQQAKSDAQTPSDKSPIPTTGYVGAAHLGDLSSANYATYVIIDGKTRYWGYMIGGGIDTKLADLPAAEGAPTFVAVSAGGHSNMALDSTGHVWASGGNIMGEMGIGSVEATNKFYWSWVTTPMDDQGQPFDHVVVIQEGFCGSSALKDDGTLWFWGLNGDDGLPATTASDNHGMTGITGAPLPTTGCPWGGDPAADPHCYTTRPHQIAFPKNGDGTNVLITKYSYGFNTPLAIDQNGNVWTWGTLANVDGVFEVSTPVKVTLPTRPGARVVDVASSGDHWLALADDGHLYGWAVDNGGAKLGIGDGKYTWTPTPNPIDVTAQPGFAPLVGKIARIYSSGPASYIVDASGSVWAWGSQVIGSVGSGPTGISQGIGVDSVNNWSWSSSVAMVMTPTKILSNVAVFYARGYSYNAFAITTDGTLYAWARDKFGNLGDGCVGDHAPNNQPDICDVGTPKSVTPF